MAETRGQLTCSVVDDIVKQHFQNAFEDAKSSLADLTSSAEDLPGFWHLVLLFCHPDRTSFRVFYGSFTGIECLWYEQVKMQGTLVDKLIEIGHAESRAKELRHILLNMLNSHLDLLCVERIAFQDDTRAAIARSNVKLQELYRQCKSPSPRQILHIHNT